MCGLRTGPHADRDADRDPKNISDPRTDCGSFIDEKLQTRTDADPNP